MDVCVCLFCLCSPVCAGSGLRRADPPSKDCVKDE
jgi:hypothetical protein